MTASFNKFCRIMIGGGTMGLLLLSLFSCENDIKSVSKLNRIDTLPTVTIHHMEVKQSEQGRLSMILTAPEMKAYTGDKSRTVFPKGVHIVFYDSVMKPVSELTAGYGIRNDARNTMEARINVVVHNLQKNTTLNTEELIWDKNTRKTTSSKFVKITSPERIIMGDGMESDEIFDNWNIKNVRGVVYVNDVKK